MKNPLSKILLLLGIVILSITGCKKDALEIEKEMVFYENTPDTTNPELVPGITLTLKPGGTAKFFLSTDITRAATYKINGKKLIVNVPDLDKKFRFTIVSETELRGEKGEILKLVGS